MIIKGQTYPHFLFLNIFSFPNKNFPPIFIPTRFSLSRRKFNYVSRDELAGHTPPKSQAHPYVMQGLKKGNCGCHQIKSVFKILAWHFRGRFNCWLDIELMRKLILKTSKYYPKKKKLWWKFHHYRKNNDIMNFMIHGNFSYN